MAGFIKKKGKKRFVVLAIVIAAIVFVINGVLESKYSASEIKFGVTFSPRYAKYLQLDWQKTYLQILDNLKVKNLRIPTYWDILEPQPDQFNFTETDYLLNEAGKRQARMIVVVGAKQPRWPECHIPAWAEKLTVEKRQEELLQFIGKVVQRYKDDPQIWAWQIENEPMLVFGEGCDKPDINFLKKEVELVKSLSGKTVIMTDSGELGFWQTPMFLSDVFGTTLYRQVSDRFLGYMTYPLPPYFYSIKSSLIRSIFAPESKKTIIVELQAEPWLADGVFAPSKQQAERFTTKNFENYIDFSQKTGFDEVYLWGAEWWYFMGEQGYPEYLEFAKTLF